MSGRPAPRNRLWVVGPALLVVMALGQQGAAHLADLSPWMGGGYGMFASIDRPQNRSVQAYVTTDDGQVFEVDIDRWRDPVYGRQLAVRAALALPAEAVLRELAVDISRSHWDDRRPAGPTSRSESTVAADRVVSVEVVVSRVEFDSGTRAVAFRELRRLVVEVGG